MGVYFLAKESTSFSVSDLFAWASSTSCMRRERVELPTVVVVRTTSCVDPTLMEPAVTKTR